jgi:hypothetical protein
VVRGVEGRAEGQQFEEGHAQPVHVAAAVGPALEPLGRHVAKGPDDVARGRQVTPPVGLGEAEVDDPDGALVIHQQVRRLDVAVQDALVVRVGQRLGDLEAGARDPAVVLRPRPAG